MHVRRLLPADAAAYQAMRLQALENEPSAFGSSHEEELNIPAAEVAQRMPTEADAAIFGGFDAAGVLIGCVGLGRERMLKLRHKGFLWGMYVQPAWRGTGVGRALVQAALGLARQTPDMLRVNLYVNATNAPAVRLYTSLGFVVYGTEDEAMCVAGEYQREHLMAWRR